MSTEGIQVATLPATLDLAALPVGERGLWSWVAAAREGRACRLELPSGASKLSDLAVALHLIARACELAGAVTGPIGSGGKDLAMKAVLDPLEGAARVGAVRACSACGVLWDDRAYPDLARTDLNVVICPGCSTRHPVEVARDRAERVIYSEPVPEDACWECRGSGVVAQTPGVGADGTTPCPSCVLVASCRQCEAIDEGMDPWTPHSEHVREALPPPPPPDDPSSGVGGWF